MAKIVTLDHHSGITSKLQDILAARMGNIGKAKYTGQLAATIGCEFNLNLLSKIATYDATSPAESLSTLQSTGLIMKLCDNLY